MASSKQRRSKHWMVVGAALLCLSFALSVSLVIAGSALNGPAWWDSKSFLVNIVSACTGALFGIPFAVVILYRVSAAQAEAAEWKTTRRLAVFAIREFNEVAKPRLDYSEASQMLQDTVASIADAHQRFVFIQDWINTNMYSVNATVNEAPGGPVRVAARDAQMSLLKAQSCMEKIVPDPTLAGSYAELIEHRWQFLDTYIRPRILESGDDWLDDGVYAQMQIILRRCPPPQQIVAFVQSDTLDRLARRLETWRTKSPLDASIVPISFDTTSLNTARLEALGMQYMFSLCTDLEEYLVELERR